VILHLYISKKEKKEYISKNKDIIFGYFANSTLCVSKYPMVFKDKILTSTCCSKGLTVFNCAVKPLLCSVSELAAVQ